jgi:hypothetical protein
LVFLNRSFKSRQVILVFPFIVHPPYLRPDAYCRAVGEHLQVAVRRFGRTSQKLVDKIAPTGEAFN